MPLRFVNEEVGRSPQWKHRRRLIYSTCALCFTMIIFGMLTYRSDTNVSRELIVGAVSLLTIILTAYTGFATIDDKWHDV